MSKPNFFNVTNNDLQNEIGIYRAMISQDKNLPIETEIFKNSLSLLITERNARLERDEWRKPLNAADQKELSPHARLKYMIKEKCDIAKSQYDMHHRNKNTYAITEFWRGRYYGFLDLVNLT